MLHLRGGTVNYCLKEFHLERGSVQAITTAHINTWTDSKVDFKKLIWEAFSETSHALKTELPAKKVTNIYVKLSWIKNMGSGSKWHQIFGGCVSF